MEYILKHGAGNPRNSEGSFVKLADGTLYFAYSRYNGTSNHDKASADIAAVRSRDHGCTWSEPEIVLHNTQLNLMSVSLLRLQDGRIAMVFLENSTVPGWPDFIDCRPKIIFSSDEASTWSEPVEIAKVPPGYFVVNNDRLVQLADGRLILPAAHHQYNEKKAGTGIVKFFISDNGGADWHISSQYIYPPFVAHMGLMEPGVIELRDHSLLCFIRSAAGNQYKSFSYDRGESWTTAVPACEFPSPESPLSMKRNEADGKIYAVWNDYDPLRHVKISSRHWDRTPLVMAESSDEGASWQNHRLLEDSPDHGYCYTAMFFDGDLLHLGYCCGGAVDCESCLQDTKLRTLKLS